MPPYQRYGASPTKPATWSPQWNAGGTPANQSHDVGAGPASRAPAPQPKTYNLKPGMQPATVPQKGMANPMQAPAQPQMTVAGLWKSFFNNPAQTVSNLYAPGAQVISNFLKPAVNAISPYLQPVNPYGWKGYPGATADRGAASGGKPNAMQMGYGMAPGQYNPYAVQIEPDMAPPTNTVLPDQYLRQNTAKAEGWNTPYYGMNMRLLPDTAGVGSGGMYGMAGREADQRMAAPGATPPSLPAGDPNAGGYGGYGGYGGRGGGGGGGASDRVGQWINNMMIWAINKPGQG